MERDPRHEAGRPKRRRPHLRRLHSDKALPLDAGPQLLPSPVPHVPLRPQPLLHRRLRRQDLDLPLLLLCEGVITVCSGKACVLKGEFDW